MAQVNIDSNRELLREKAGGDDAAFIQANEGWLQGRDDCEGLARFNAQHSVLREVTRKTFILIILK